MLTEPEIWKPVPSVPGLSASSWGRIRIEPYEQKMPRGGVKIVKGEPRYGDWEEDGRRFHVQFKRKTYKVHILVCEAFNGPKPFPDAVVMHDDEDGSHNVPNNLIWGTQKENMNYPGFKAAAAARLREYSLARMQTR
ncbi:HNH endonuclease [uncultured Methylobacterium sp.]|jgi:hypothetical protein|uniref:HNH endonuclease n=1 Tax=uncultured Methylobacterium sp. TaxID=157278 RepID=UPI00260AE44C|nr:HNH endonuclease [uncultured Methylobacterium sp.]